LPRQIAEERDRIILSNPPKENFGGSAGGYRGDPTGQKGAKLATERRLGYLVELRKQLTGAIERLPKDLYQIYLIKYEQGKGNEEVWRELGIGRTTFYRQRNKLVESVDQILKEVDNDKSD